MITICTICQMCHMLGTKYAVFMGIKAGTLRTKTGSEDYGDCIEWDGAAIYEQER